MSIQNINHDVTCVGSLFVTSAGRNTNKNVMVRPPPLHSGRKMRIMLPMLHYTRLKVFTCQSQVYWNYQNDVARKVISCRRRLGRSKSKPWTKYASNSSQQRKLLKMHLKKCWPRFYKKYSFNQILKSCYHKLRRRVKMLVLQLIRFRSLHKKKVC